MLILRCAVAGKGKRREVAQRGRRSKSGVTVETRERCPYILPLRMEFVEVWVWGHLRLMNLCMDDGRGHKEGLPKLAEKPCWNAGGRHPPPASTDPGEVCHEIKPAVDGYQAGNWRRDQRRHCVAPLLPGRTPRMSGFFFAHLTCLGRASQSLGFFLRGQRGNHGNGQGWRASDHGRPCGLYYDGVQRYARGK